MTIGPIPHLNFQSQWPSSKLQEFGDEAETGGAGGVPGCCDQEHGGPRMDGNTESAREVSRNISPLS